MEKNLINLLHATLHLKQFKQIHALVLTKNLNLTAFFLKRLLNLSFIDYARKVFDGIPHPDQNLYSSVISTYFRLSLNKEVVDTFFLMHHKQTQIIYFAVPHVLKSCASLSATAEGRQVHSLVIRYGFGFNVFIQTGLIDFYAKTGDLDSAKQVFDEILVKDPVAYNCLISGYSKSGRVLEARHLFDEMPARTIVSWNSMISCYTHNGDLMEGLRMFELMQIEGVNPNENTLGTVLSICAKLGDLEMGLKVKKFIDDNNLQRNLILSTAILEMYVKCGAVDDARQEFDQMDRRDVVAWSAMIAGYAQNGRSNEALELFEQMKMQKIKPNDITLVSILSACGQLGSVEAGERIGNYIESQGFSFNVYVGSALLDMYAKCGNIRKARQVFDEMPKRDVVSWNSMIGGLAVNGFAMEAIDLYVKMKETGVKPNDITFVALLTACTHAGLVELGCGFFESIRSDHKIAPKVEHYACIVDLFCKSGRLVEAYEFICKMEVEPNVVIWGTLLSACRIHSNLELAERAVEKLLVLEPENSGNYVLLSNMYAGAGRWEESLKTRVLMREKRVQKTAAYSWIEVEDRVHKFLVGDSSHQRSDEIYTVVNGLSLQLKSAGYALNSDFEFS
ncbi:pentatricopeptide repeat-containing protein At1g08070, chloroplastic-like [Magnolia sinica]|uniref:pentatricopeptide repeat-containing protein At1g08070, chloroplastic-like n=1 Tax=Magnolia sinica TaxID=86752 RepID=UPI0026583E0D|nr:pentatricopeptide repeat-containing protein At1g08070, chloroplastic-like [Magnolia sinica]